MPDIWMDVDAALSEVPVNVFPLTDDTDFKTQETAVAYNAAGMALKWNFVTTAGAYTQTAVTPTTAGDYDWTHQGGGMYSIEIPASGGASINNDTEGFGWFSGVATGVLPWRGPTVGFRAAGLNDLLIDTAYSTTRGLTGTALPAVAAGANGGLPLSVDSSGRVDVLKVNGTSQTARDIGASVLLSSGSGTGQLDFTSGVVKANLAQILGTALTETAGQIAAGFKKFFNIATPAATMDHGVLVDTVTTYTGNTPQTGDSYALANGAAGFVATKAVADAVKVKTDNLPASPAAVGSAMTLTNAYDFAKGTVAMTEAYAADGAAPTPVQALFAMLSDLMEFSISGTTITAKKLDGSTTAMTFTIDDATNPTSKTRSA